MARNPRPTSFGSSWTRGRASTRSRSKAGSPLSVGEGLTILALVLPLCLDTFAVSAALGVAGLPAARRLRVSLLMTAFEVGMPVVGLLLGGLAGKLGGGLADYAAIAVLAGLGLWMLRPEGEDEEKRLAALAGAGGLAAIGLGLSISLDELAMGVTFGLLRLPLAPALVAIGILALAASQAGLRLGARVGEAARERSEKAAGVILLLLAALLLVLRLAG